MILRTRRLPTWFWNYLFGRYDTFLPRPNTNTRSGVGVETFYHIGEGISILSQREKFELSCLPHGPCENVSTFIPLWLDDWVSGPCGYVDSTSSFQYDRPSLCNFELRVAPCSKLSTQLICGKSLSSTLSTARCQVQFTCPV